MAKTTKWKNYFNWEKIKGDIEKETKSKKKGDPRIFKPDWKAAIAKKKFYTLRFLPDKEGNPFAHYYSHSFQYPASDGSQKKWYINNCISTFGWDPKCPICGKNSEYYNSAYESDKKLGKERQRQQNWISNILVVNDPINPENNGEVFLYRYGYKIYQKLETQMFPKETDLEDPDFEEFMPFDLFEGADFKLKIKKQGDYPNYDESSFSSPKPIFNGDEDKIDEIMSKVYDLSEFTDPKNYPTVEETIKQVGHLLGVTPTLNEEDEEDEDENDGNFEETETNNEADQEADQEDTNSQREVHDDSVDDEETSSEGEDSELDDDEAFFANLSK
jgi:hypothetical protein